VKLLMCLLMVLIPVSAFGTVLWESGFDGHSSDKECCEEDGNCTGAMQTWDTLDLYTGMYQNVEGTNWGECNTIIGGAAERSDPGGSNKRGFRIYLDSQDFPNGENKLEFQVDPVDTFYFRWYSRFSFTPNGTYIKTHRLSCSGVGQCLIVDWLNHNGGSGTKCQLTLSVNPYDNRFSWDHTCAEMPVDTWVCYEMFIDIPNEQATLWVDGVSQGTDTETDVNVDWNVYQIAIGGNQGGFTEPTPPDEETMDYDDVVVSDEYIGPADEEPAAAATVTGCSITGGTIQ